MSMRHFSVYAAILFASTTALMGQNAPATSPTTAPIASISTVKPTPPTPPEKSAARIHLKDGFEVELMVSEPLVIDPVAIAFGPDGKLWVIEMTEYPLGKHGTLDPSGRVVYLESTHGDGKYDKVTVFAENLNFPNGIIPWHKGVIVTSAPDILYLEDTTGNGKADKKEVLYTGFTQGNPQLRINSPTWGLDNWIYLANGLSSHDEARSLKTGETIKTAHRDVRIRPDEGHIEAETGESQYGRKMDNWGNWFGVHNSYPARAFMIPQKYADRNPLVQLPDGLDDCGWPRNPKVFPVSNGTKRYGYYFFAQSGHFTSACSVTPYRDDLLFGPLDPNSAMDHIFVCEPAHNLVQHIIAAPSGSGFQLKRAADEEFNEFMASDDDWSRPVFLSSAPDGALWVVDMYRFFIDHPEYLPPEGQKDMKPYYRLGEDKGAHLSRLSEREKAAAHSPARSTRWPATGRRDGIAQRLATRHGADDARLEERSDGDTDAGTSRHGQRQSVHAHAGDVYARRTGQTFTGVGRKRITRCVSDGATPGHSTGRDPRRREFRVDRRDRCAGE